MKPSTKSLYHPINNPPYQVNYRAKRSGKHITCTKRRVTFVFGFSSAEAIASGLTEGDCRGEEHEVVLIWSHVSGKRQIFVDGREIHISKAARGNTKFSHAWGIGNHVLKIEANATPPSDGSRQFDLFLDGMSFFHFRQIYQLGTGKPTGVVRLTKRIEDEQLARTETISTGSCSRSPTFQTEEDSVCDPPIAELKIDIMEAPSDSQDLLALDLPSPSYSTYSQPVSQATTFSSYDEFSPVNASNNWHNRSFAAISNEILTAYSTNDNYQPVQSSAPQIGFNNAPRPSYSCAPPMNSAPQDQVNTHAIVPSNIPVTYNTHSVPAEPQKPVISMYDNVIQEDNTVDAITKSINNLVNLDDVSKPSRASRSSAHTKQQDKSQSLQSLQWALASSGRAPTLSEIHSMKSRAGASSAPVMNNSLQMVSTSVVMNQGVPQQYGYYGATPGAYASAY
jgi:hypothetical protein